MTFTILTAENFKTSKWSGGTTTQLYIYPPDADYVRRDFDFRLSTAKVELETSDFTPLPGISRKIMILDGKIIIKHENHYSKTLSKFDTDAFEGDWKTAAEGKCTDFNLMTRGKTQGALSALIIEKSETKEIMAAETATHFFIYVVSGKVNVDFESETVVLEKHNLLVVSNLNLKPLQLSGIEISELVVVEIETI